ncbi:UTRA domain-containing protein [Nanchangia anserum]|uniref:UTRA domain-containing protein n=1 Tax=Nanchangia anserum TaxID=2692125 RepID=A0A8I0G6F5_9ACTO|nr:UTRA domain-containing protein [Nanchangia anserum]MBD3688652.1 UTRA domain-containing protein [Nanchangia anserum]QOX82406.1 UTRA domain-containing protein [Nanchangia anserum]
MRRRYDQIFTDLLADLEKGTPAFGEYLPSEAQLTQRFSCSNNTVRRALRMLNERGYVQPVPGKGVRVAYRPTPRPDLALGGIESFAEVTKRHGRDVRTRVVSLTTVHASPSLAERSGFAPGETLTRVERVRIIDSAALILDTSFFSLSLVGGLTGEIAEDSIYRHLEHTLGMRVALSKRSITVEAATSRDRSLLDLGDASVVVVVTSETFDHLGNLIEYTVSRHHPDSFCFRTTAVRENV